MHNSVCGKCSRRVESLSKLKEKIQIDSKSLKEDFANNLKNESVFTEIEASPTIAFKRLSKVQHDNEEEGEEESKKNSRKKLKMDEEMKGKEIHWGTNKFRYKITIIIKFYSKL